MASSLDITPAKGHGLVTAQNMPGGYDAIDDRRQWGVGRQEGATTALAYKVTERSEGANLSVDIATEQGAFLVQGDDEDWQSLYLVPPTALKTNLDLADPPDITNPRVDQVVLEAHDDVYYGNDGTTRGRVYILSGTPTSGADVVDSAAYTSSKAALPPSTARLAEFVVPANATSIATAAIRDRRPWALGAFRTLSVGSPGALHTDATTDTANYKHIRSEWKYRMEFSGAPVRAVLDGVFTFNAGDANKMLWNLHVGETDVITPATVISLKCGHVAMANGIHSWTIEWHFVPQPGSKIISPVWIVGTSGTFSMFSQNVFGSLPSFPRFTVEEILRPNATNG